MECIEEGSPCKQENTMALWDKSSILKEKEKAVNHSYAHLHQYLTRKLASYVY